MDPLDELPLGAGSADPGDEYMSRPGLRTQGGHRSEGLDAWTWIAIGIMMNGPMIVAGFLIWML